MPNGRTLVLYAGLTGRDAEKRPLQARLNVASGTLRLEVNELSAKYPMTIYPIALQAYLKASNAEGAVDRYEYGDFFGQPVAVSGDTAVVGAPGRTAAPPN